MGKRSAVSLDLIECAERVARLSPGRVAPTTSWRAALLCKAQGRSVCWRTSRSLNRTGL